MANRRREIDIKKLKHDARKRRHRRSHHRNDNKRGGYVNQFESERSETVDKNVPLCQIMSNPNLVNKNVNSSDEEYGYCRYNNYPRTLYHNNSNHIRFKESDCEDPQKLFYSIIIKKNKQRKEEICLILENWIRYSSIRRGWIIEFNEIITKYAKFFTLLKILYGHHGIVKSVRFSADGHKIASASDDHTVRVWDVKSGIPMQIFKGRYPILMAEFSPNGHIVAAVSDDGIQIWDMKLKRNVKNFAKSSSACNISFSPNGKYIASCSTYMIEIWDVNSKQQGKKLKDFPTGPAVHFSPNGEMIAGLYDDTIIGIWDVKSGTMSKEFIGHSDNVTCVKFSPDEAEKEIQILEGHSDIVNEVKYFPDGQIIISCSDDKTIRLWDVKSGQEIQRLEGHLQMTRIDISSDSSVIVSCSNDRTIQLWR
ncbi:hypothetical protein RFI_22984 [Reticulomyxa filosa]|uniref:Anaphase-promoting complex subunit 4-like WD40 domain-containing protein n=1 Tax=Reticulomyxa filosa TaxID=46433 RepID=X6MKN3_RETFI|nr:hypothetical protein RFI_22984 [Reticulomyxa filosa]|eukprot:ETO14384.1 hypothetical protein RFI_22984 [Reticulomyxa filosa]